MIDQAREHLEGGFDAHVGVELVEMTDELVRARLELRADLLQPIGLLHGGVYATVAESTTSIATALSVVDEGMIATGQSNQASFLRPVTDGALHVEARRRHRGRTSWIWDVDFTDDAGRLCAVVRMTIAVRPGRRDA